MENIIVHLLIIGWFLIFCTQESSAIFKQFTSNASSHNVIPAYQLMATIGLKTSNLVNIHNGYDISDIIFSGDAVLGTWKVINRTPRKFSSISAFIRDKVYQLFFYNNAIIDEFSNNNITIAGIAPFQSGDTAYFIDPHPLFRAGASSFSNNNRTVPPSEGVIVGLNEAEVRVYHRIEIGLKYIYADPRTRQLLIDFIRDPSKCVVGDCSESDHSLSDALSKWYRVTTETINAQLVAFDNSGATGLAAGSWYGMHRAVFIAAVRAPILNVLDGGYSKLSGYWTFSHENGHEHGYSHQSGMTYGWQDYIDRMVNDLVNATVLSTDFVPIEVSSTAIVRQRGNIFYVASGRAASVKVVSLLVTYNAVNIDISNILWDPSDTYFTINVVSGSDLVVIEARLSDRSVAYSIVNLDGFFPASGAPQSLKVLKPAVRYISGSFHIYPPMTTIGSRKIEYVSSLDGGYIMSGTTNVGCYYCYRSGYTDWWTGATPSQSSVFTVTVTDESKATYTFAYSAADAISGFSDSVLVANSVKIRNGRFIIQLPVDKIGPRNISFRALLDGKPFFKDNRESTGQICYDCYFFGPRTNIQNLDFSQASDIVSNATQFPYVVSLSLNASYINSVSMLTLQFVDRLSIRLKSTNYSIASLRAEQATAPTPLPVRLPTVKPSTPSTLRPTTPTAVPSSVPSKPTLLPTAPTRAPTGAYVRHVNLISGSGVPIKSYGGVCGGCNTLALCQQACDIFNDCRSIQFTYPYYSRCYLFQYVNYTSGWDQVYDKSGYTPTVTPVSRPTLIPSIAPKLGPTTSPTRSITVPPTPLPTTLKPTAKLTSIPSVAPTLSPTVSTTVPPTLPPTTLQPTLKPTASPTRSTTAPPTPLPTTVMPTVKPTSLPSMAPKLTPTSSMTASPTLSPTTLMPTAKPTLVQSFAPKLSPTTSPSRPTTMPSTPPPTVVAPTAKPTSIPSATPSITRPPTSSPIQLVPSAPIIYSLQAQSFSGSNFLRINVNPIASSNWDNFTFSAWITTSTASCSLVSLGRTPSNYDGEFVLSLYRKRLSFFDYSYATGYGFQGSGTTKVVANGVRAHIAFVKAGLQSKIYVNGQVDAVLQSSSLVRYLRQDLVLGADYRDGNAYLTGAMETIKVFGSSLSDGDILALYTAG